jgi:hypothetical protein
MLAGMTFIASVILIYFVLSFRYVWKAKHPKLGIWKAYARAFLIICGTPFVVFLTAYIISAIVYGFMGATGTFGSLGRVVIGSAAMFPLLPAIYLVRRIINTPPHGFTESNLETSSSLINNGLGRS